MCSVVYKQPASDKEYGSSQHYTVGYTLWDILYGAIRCIGYLVLKATVGYSKLWPALLCTLHTLLSRDVLYSCNVRALLHCAL